MSWAEFDARADRYDSWYERNAIIYENELEAVRALGLRGRGVEVGVGTGRFAAPLGVEFGIDMSESMLRLAASRGLDVARADASLLPVRGSSLDYALFVVTLCFLDDPTSALREARLALRPGGFVVACIVPRDSAWGEYYMRRGGPFYSVARFYTTDEVLSMMRSVGLRPGAISSTLSFSPLDPPRREPPGSDPRWGFVCVRSHI